MPKMDGIELSCKILELDANVKICLVTAGESNIEVLRELYPTRSIGCFIKKPVTIDQLVRRVKAELRVISNGFDNEYTSIYNSNNQHTFSIPHTGNSLLFILIQSRLDCFIITPLYKTSYCEWHINGKL